MTTEFTLSFLSVLLLGADQQALAGSCPADSRAQSIFTRNYPVFHWFVVLTLPPTSNSTTQDPYREGFCGPLLRILTPWLIEGVE